MNNEQDQDQSDTTRQEEQANAQEVPIHQTDQDAEFTLAERLLKELVNILFLKGGK